LIREENKETYKIEQRGSEIPSIQSHMEQLTIEEADRSRAKAFYCCHLHPKTQYQLFEDSRAMVCSCCKEEKCRFCFSDYHGGGGCDANLKIQNIGRQRDLVFERLKLTGKVEEYLRTCDSCKLNVFKHLDQSSISCFFCSEELEN